MVSTLARLGRGPWRPRMARCLFAALVPALAACAPPVRPPAYTPRDEVPLAGTPTGIAGWPSPEWWKRYDDPQLDRLIDLATKDSPNLEQADARYRTALRAVDTQKANLSPQVRGLLDGSHGFSDIKLHGQAPGATGSTQGFQLDPGRSWSNNVIAGALFTWDLDLWGKQKDAVAAAVGQARAAEAERATASSSLQLNVAMTYFNWQAINARLALAHEAEHQAEDFRGLVKLRVDHGLDDPTTMDQADAQLASQRQQLAALEGGAALDLAQLAAIVGVSPQELGKLDARPLPVADTTLPPDARLELIARRPDIVAARWQIEAASRSIDSARKAYYPDVSLMALGAFLRTWPDLGSGTRTDLALGNVGPSIQLPIYSGGRLKAAVESSQAALDTAVAAYNAAVVQAAQDVSRQILTMQQLGAEQTQQALSLQANVSQDRRTGERRNRGIIDDRQYITTQLQVIEQKDSQLQLAAQLLSTNLTLINALGGGYHTDHLPALPAATAKDETQ